MYVSVSLSLHVCVCVCVCVCVDAQGSGAWYNVSGVGVTLLMMLFQVLLPPLPCLALPPAFSPGARSAPCASLSLSLFLSSIPPLPPFLSLPSLPSSPVGMTPLPSLTRALIFFPFARLCLSVSLFVRRAQRASRKSSRAASTPSTPNTRSACQCSCLYPRNMMHHDLPNCYTQDWEASFGVYMLGGAWLVGQIKKRLRLKRLTTAAYTVSCRLRWAEQWCVGIRGIIWEDPLARGQKIVWNVGTTNPAGMMSAFVLCVVNGPFLICGWALLSYLNSRPTLVPYDIIVREPVRSTYV